MLISRVFKLLIVWFIVISTVAFQNYYWNIGERLLKLERLINWVKLHHGYISSNVQVYYVGRESGFGLRSSPAQVQPYTVICKIPKKLVIRNSLAGSAVFNLAKRLIKLRARKHPYADSLPVIVKQELIDDSVIAQVNRAWENADNDQVSQPEFLWAVLNVITRVHHVGENERALVPVIDLFNYAKEPNVNCDEQDEDFIICKNVRLVNAGEQLTVTYRDTSGRNPDKELLLKQWGIRSP